MKLSRLLSINRSPEPAQSRTAGNPDELAEWKIQEVREAISQDWNQLASKNLTREQRRALREHLEMNLATLRHLIERNQLAKSRTEVAVDMGAR